MAERTDTVVRRVDDGGHDYGDGTATAASAMAKGSEGVRQGANERVQGVGVATWSLSRPAGRRGEEAGRQPAAWHALVPPSGTCLPACLAGKHLAGAVAGLGRQVGLVGGAR